ncbi:MAG TPA: FixH family protein [Myxococcota bacterium]|jgi:nitrogen fixation protein FixH
MGAEARQTSRLRGREPWPLAIVGLLLVMAAVLAGFLSAALLHPDPVIVSDSYAASQRYDSALRAADRASQLGLRVTLTAQPAPGGTRVAVRLLGADGRALPADRVLVHRERPTQGGFDASVEATPDSDGWTAFVALPLPGSWILEARVERGGELVSRRIAVEAGS